MARKIDATDIEGEKFGLLTVKNFIERKNNRIFYECVCDCGNHKVMDRSQLRDKGRSPSCGCDRSKSLEDKDYIGLMVVADTKQRDNNGELLVTAKCKHCGSIKEYRRCNVSKNKSCGCLKDKLIGEANSTHGQRYTRLYQTWIDMRRRCNNKNRAKYEDYGGRGISYLKDWDSFEVFYDWAMSNGYDDSLTIDRIDNDKNYTPDNCRWTTMKVQQNNRRDNVLINIEGIEKSASEWGREIDMTEQAIFYRIHTLGFKGKDIIQPKIKNKGKNKKKVKKIG